MEPGFNLPGRREFIITTPKVEECLRESQVREGLCLVNAMHITASVFINDDERGLHADYEDWLEELAPHEPISRYRHNRTGEDNGDAHLKRNATRQVARDGPRGRRSDHGRTARLWPVGADLLRRVRRPAQEARLGQDHRRVGDGLVQRAAACPTRPRTMTTLGALWPYWRRRATPSTRR